MDEQLYLVETKENGGESVNVLPVHELVAKHPEFEALVKNPHLVEFTVRTLQQTVKVSRMIKLDW